MHQEDMPDVLVVDLDGTLLRSDMLYECFWSTLGQDWRDGAAAVSALMKGKASLKRQLATSAKIDATTLPYNDEVIALVTDWRENGGRTALVSATDQSVLDPIAAHLDLFDEVHGSDGQINLKGEAKARFLSEHFGDGGYAYVGDALADIPVWKAADKIFTVDAPHSLRESVNALGPEAQHLGAENRAFAPYLKALRPHQWLKNILVFLPMLVAHQFSGITLLQSLLAFVSFSLIASSVYVVNDLLDLSVDRSHPRKCRRPFAAGSIPIAHGTWMAGGLIALGTLIASLLGWSFLIIIAVYFITTTAYSLVLKRRVVVDICTLAALYTLRIVAGGAATGIELSVWLLAFAIFFFLSLAAVKRQAELVDTIERGKIDVSGRGYQVSDLPVISMMAISAGYVGVLVMALYVNSPDIAGLYSMPSALWGICFILLYWISRTVMIASRGQMHDDPVVFAVRDKISRVCFVIILCLAIAGTIA